MSKSVRRKNRKRSAVKPGGSPFSKALREASALIQSGKQADGLGLLNQLAAESKNPTRRGKISLQIATSQAALSRHGEAAAAFAKAAQFGHQAGDADLALKGGIGEVRSLLRSLRTEEAKAAAALILADLDKAQKDFDALAALTPAQLASAGGITIPARPPRPSVGLTQLANAFIESGLTDEARVFLQKAVLLTPNGASRARQALAKLALAADQPAEAERYARESLQMGRFQAKTIAAWQYYLDARARQNRIPIAEPEILEALFTHTTGRILSNSGLSIVRVLRGHGDPAWKEIATRLLFKPAKGDSVVLTEIEKILHADAKLTLSESSLSLAARALKFFKAKDVSPSEQIAHGKEYIRYSFESGNEPQLAAIVQVAIKRFGVEHAATLRHACVLGAILARKCDTARSWLLLMLTDLTVGSEGWGKATWALARMESELEGRAGEAAFWYLEVAGNEGTPARFRIQAMLRGFKFLILSGESIDIQKLNNSIQSMLINIDDYRVALDAGRQLTLAGRSFNQIKMMAVTRGETLASQEINASADPKKILIILEYLARRQVYDLYLFKPILSRWDSFTNIQKKDFAAVGGALWYEYLSLVFRSMIRSDREADAINLVSDIVNGPQATSEGYVIIGSEYAAWLMKMNKKTDAFSYFEWIAMEAPSHRRAAESHYWLALAAKKRGDTLEIAERAKAIRKCFGGCPSLLGESRLDAAALVILYGEDLDLAHKASGANYSKTFFEKAKKRIEEDLQKI